MSHHPADDLATEIRDAIMAFEWSARNEGTSSKIRSRHEKIASRLRSRFLDLWPKFATGAWTAKDLASLRRLAKIAREA